jgi:hypothetical protein
MDLTGLFDLALEAVEVVPDFLLGDHDCPVVDSGLGLGS